MGNCTDDRAEVGSDSITFGVAADSLKVLLNTFADMRLGCAELTVDR